MKSSDLSRSVSPPFSKSEKAVLQSSFEEFLETLKIEGVKHSQTLDIFGHEDTEGIIQASAGPLRNTLEGRAESDRWWPPEAFQGKDVLIFKGGGNLPFVLLRFGARSVTIADTDPRILAWQRAKVVYGGCPELNPLFSTRSIPFKDKAEYTDLLRILHQKVMGDSPPTPYRGGENFHFLPVGLFDSLELHKQYDLIFIRDIFGIPKGLSTEQEFDTAFRNLLRYRRVSGSLFFLPIDYAEELAGYTGDSFYPWLKKQDLASFGLALVPPRDFHRIALSRITFLPDALLGSFAWLRPRPDEAEKEECGPT